MVRGELVGECGNLWVAWLVLFMTRWALQRRVGGGADGVGLFADIAGMG